MEEFWYEERCLENLIGRIMRKGGSVKDSLSVFVKMKLDYGNSYWRKGGSGGVAEQGRK